MPIQVGILGVAHGHVNGYCKKWAEDASMDTQAVACWDHDADRAGKFGASYKLEVCSSAQELLKRKDIQAVVIASETSFHAELVEGAARAGKAIVVQKPLALTLEQADRIVAAVAKAGVPFTVAWQMRVDPQNLQMKSLIQGGQLGRVFMVRRRHGLGTHTWKDFETSWHVQPQYNRDMWADDSSHPIDFILWLLGKPVSVMAELGTLHNPKVPMDNGIAVFRYADGTFAEVCCSFVSLAGENTTEIIAEKGVVEQNFGDAPSSAAPRPAGAAGLKWFLQGANEWTVSDIASPGNHGERIVGLARPLAEFLHGRRAPIATAEEGKTALQMVLACYESYEKGKRIGL